MNCSISTFMPQPTARRAVPSAAVVLPLPGPVLMRIKPLREDASEFIVLSSEFVVLSLQFTVLSSQFTASESCAQTQLRTKNCELRTCARELRTCAPVVRMARENCTGPVELLGHNQARQLVRQRHRSQR